LYNFLYKILYKSFHLLIFKIQEFPVFMDEKNSKNNIKKHINSEQNFELPEWIEILKRALDEQKKNAQIKQSL